MSPPIFQMLDIVELTEDVTIDGYRPLKAGEGGTILEIFTGDHFMVELNPDEDGSLCMPVLHVSVLKLDTAFADMGKGHTASVLIG